MNTTYSKSCLAIALACVYSFVTHAAMVKHDTAAMTIVQLAQYIQEKRLLGQIPITEEHQKELDHIAQRSQERRKITKP